MYIKKGHGIYRAVKMIRERWRVKVLVVIFWVRGRERCDEKGILIPR